MADEQWLGEIPPIGDWCESAFGDQGKSTQLKSVIHRRQYLRETFEFPGVTSLLDFIHSTCFVLLVMFVCNQLFNFSERRLSSGLFICAYKVIQRITTGVIPLEAIHIHYRKGLILSYLARKSTLRLSMTFILLGSLPIIRLISCHSLYPFCLYSTPLLCK